jgi:hypothetical protein
LTHPWSARNPFSLQGVFVARTTIAFGIVLIALGVAGYLGTGRVSVTALIPAAFGLVLGILGWLALNDRYRRHAMHAAAALGLIGLLGSLRGLPGLVALLTGAGVDRPAAVVAQSAMALLMAVFVALCVKSFVDARRARIGPGAP